MGHIPKNVIAKAIVKYLAVPVDDRVAMNEDLIMKSLQKNGPKAPTAPTHAPANGGSSKTHAETWSSRLVRENPNSRWITYRGNHLLIRTNKDGSGTVIFSAHPAFEHLKLKPMSKEQYSQTEKDVEQQKKFRGKRESDYSPEELAASKKVNKQRQELASQMRTKYIDNILNIANVSPEQKEMILNKDVRKLEKQVDRLLSPIEAGVGMDNAALKEALSLMKDEKDKNVKKRAAENLQSMASEALVDQTIRESLGLELNKENDVLSTGNALIDKALKKIKLNKEQAMAIKSEKVQYQSQLKQLKETFADEVIIKRGNIKITDMQGIGIEDFTTEPAKPDKVLEAAIEDVENRMRAKLNTQFYAHVDGIGNGLNKHMSDGAANEVNAFAGMFLDGGYLSRDFIDFVGVENAGKIIASEIQNKKNWEKVRDDLDKFMATKSSKLVKNTLDGLKEKFDRIQSYSKQKEEGILAGRTGAINIARQYASIGKEIGEAAGSLQVSANILDHLRDAQGEKGDVVVDGGKNLANAKEIMTKFGLADNDYMIKRGESNRYEIIIPHESFSNLITKSSISKERDKVVEAIKTGKTLKNNFLPPGSTHEYWDTKTASQLKATGTKGWEEFTNKKGEAGYTSHMKEGDKLYRKKMKDFSFQPHQQRMYEFALHGKRVVWNAGAGSGKTITALGTLNALKEMGELKNFAVISPPSRLVNEFFKDQEKYYPNLRMVNLDDIRGVNGKMKAIQDAKDGKYDILISGHDSIKIGGGKRALDKMVDQKTDEWIVQNLNGETPTSKQRKLIEAKMKAELRGNIGLPAMLAEASPGAVIIDEAHEAFKNVGSETDRSSAIKVLAKNSEYFIPMTGTPIRNDVGELASLLSVTRPDIIHSTDWKNKWKNVGSQSTLMKNQMVNEFRREFDNIMISEETKIEPKLTEKQNKISITPEQRQKYKESELQYRLDKDSDGYVGIMDLESRNLLFNGDKSDLLKMSPEQLGFMIKEGDTSADGKQATALRKWLKSNGYNPDKFHLKVLGKAGASARRDSRHDVNLHAGDWKSNAKVQQILKDFKEQEVKGNKKQVVFFNRNESLDTLLNAFKENGLSDNEIAYLEGEMNGNARKKQVNRFNTDPEVRVMLASKVGQTGLNMQQGTVNHWLSRNNTYAEQVQGNARTYRKGQQHDVTAYYNDSDTVIDNNKIDVINKKKNITEAIGEYNPKNNALK